MGTKLPSAGLLSLLCLLWGTETLPAGAFKLPNLPRKAPDKAIHALPSRHFSGRLEGLDLRHHPMTLTAILGEGHPLVFRFAGVLVPDTMVLSGGKAVGVKALKKGQMIRIDYQEGGGAGEIRKIFLLPSASPSPKGVASPPSGKNPPPKTLPPSGLRTSSR